jgi:hypothetical protein
VRLVTRPGALRDAAPTADMGYVFDDCLDRRLDDPLWGTVPTWRS